MFSSFEVIPAIDLQAGEVVQLVRGERDSATRYGEPVETAEHWVAQGAQTLHIVDLDGAFQGDRANAAVVEEICDSIEATIQLGGGIRTAGGAQRLLDAGVDRVILGTAAIKNPDLVAELSNEYPDGVLVSLDAKDGEVVVAGWTEQTGLNPAEAATRYADLGAAGILFTNVDIEGQLSGVLIEPVVRVVEAVDIPVIASGGVATLDDIQLLHESGAAAVVVGSALYEEKFSLADAIAAVR